MSKVLLDIVGGVVLNIVIVALLEDEPITNALPPMFVTLSGTTTLVKLSQKRNAALPMFVTLLGITALAKP